MEKLTEKEANRIVLEKIPFEERMKSVYYPLFTIDCASYVIEDIMADIVSLGKSGTKPAYRVLKKNIQEYQKANMEVMKSDLYNSIRKYTKEFYQEIYMSLFIFQMQYQQELLRRKIYLDKFVEALIAKCFLARELIRYSQSLDKQFSKRMSSLLGVNIVYVTEENTYCRYIVSSLEGLIKALGSPTDLESPTMIDSLRAFGNKLNKLKIW